MLTSEVWTILCNSLVSICVTGLQNLNIIGRSKLHSIWAFWQKGVNYFSQSVDAIFEEVSAAKTIVWRKTID